MAYKPTGNRYYDTANRVADRLSSQRKRMGVSKAPPFGFREVSSAEARKWWDSLTPEGRKEHLRVHGAKGVTEMLEG